MNYLKRTPLFATFSNILGFFIVLITISSCSDPINPEEGPSLPKDTRNQITETPDYISIRSTRAGVKPTTGLVFYQGGLVEAKAYQDWLDKLVCTQPTLQVILVKMPNNLAVLDPGKGLRLKGEFPNLKHWVIAGHSLGGAMAAKVVEENRDAFEALILLAAYPPPTNDLSDWNKPVLSIYGSKDAISTPEEIKSFANLLPPAYTMDNLTDFPHPLAGKTVYYEISGGNHSQFGNYGLQQGDNEADISQKQQQAIVIILINRFLNKLP